MSKKSDAPYFAVLCTEKELKAHVLVCADSDFHVVIERELGRLSVRDRDTLIVDAVQAAGAYLVRLHKAYYRHPFEASDGNAPPGVP
jgi:hypothetical protein